MAILKPSLGVSPGENLTRINALFDAVDTATTGLSATTDLAQALNSTVSAQALRLTGLQNQINAEAISRGQATQALSSSVFSAIAGVKQFAIDLGDGLTKGIIAGDEANKAAIDVYRHAFAADPSRPGDCPLAFAYVTDPASVSGDLVNLPDIPSKYLAEGDNGPVARVRGAAVIAQRQPQAIEAGRVYRVRYAVQRRADPSDPINDAVNCSIVWLDQNRHPISTALVYQFTNLRTADGRQERSALCSRSAAAGVTVSAPATARYACVIAQTFGLDAVTDIEVLEALDVTAYVVQAPSDVDQSARISALESLDIGARLDAIQAGLGTPSTLVLPGVSTLQTTQVPASIKIISLLGYAVSGDGGAARYVRSPSGSTSTEKITSADGAVWELDERVVRPEMLGAVADGVNDDLPIVSRVLAFLESRGGGVLLYSAGRTYKQHGAAIINGSNIVVTREPGALIYYPETNFSYEHCFISYGSYVTFDGLYIYSDASLSRDDTGFSICILGGYQPVIRNCTLVNIASACIWLQNCTGAVVQGNSCVTPKADGIHFTNGCDRFICINNRVDHSNDDGIAMVMDTTDAARISNGTVSGNVISDIVGGSGIVLCGVDSTIVTGNVINGTDNPGISCYNYAGTHSDTVKATPSTRITISNNTITSGGRRADASALVACGILMADGYEVKIRGNTIDSSGGSLNVTSASILLTMYRGMTIAGNTIANCSGHGVWLYDGTLAGRADLQALTVVGNDFTNIALDPIRVAPPNTNPGAIKASRNTFASCAYQPNARLVRIAYATDQLVSVLSNEGDAGQYAIDLTTCTNTVIQWNTPLS